MDSLADFHARWRPLFTLGAVLALVQLALIPVAMVFFIAFPPPDTTAELFALFERSALLGLIALDLVYMVTIAIVGVLLLSLCVALWRVTPVLALLALFLATLSTAMYFPSNTAFEMLALSREYAAATTDAQRASSIAAGDAMRAIYVGSTFTMSYVMAAVAGLLVAVAMWRSRVFGRATAALGVVANTLGLVPSNAGMVGMVAAIAFLLPYIVWLPLVAHRLWQLGRAAPLVDEGARAPPAVVRTRTPAVAS